MKKTLVAFVLALFTAPSFAGQCDFTPDKDKFAFSFTAYGFPDKSYDVKDNTFTDYELSSESGKLLNAGIVIKTASVDTTRINAIGTEVVNGRMRHCICATRIS